MPDGFSPTDLGLPFSEFREGQLDIAARIAASRKEFVLLQAPPGAGKSLIAMAALRLSEMAYPDSQTVITVATKQLQSQYVKDFGLIQMYGRSNFLCRAAGGDITCDIGPCKWASECQSGNKWGFCHYYRAKAEAIAAREVILNTAYTLYEMNYSGSLANRQVMILDEAHLLDSTITQFVSLDFPNSTLQHFGINKPRIEKEMIFMVPWALDTSLVLQDIVKGYQDVVANSPGRIKDLRELKLAESLLDRVNKLAIFGESSEEWVSYDRPDGFSYKPVYCGNYAQQYLFDFAQKKVLMSATILEPGEFCRSLGINEQGADWIETSQTFPASARPINYWPVAKVSGRNLDQAMPRLVTAIDMILDMFPNEKGVIHTTSFKLAKEIITKCRNKRRFVHHLTANRDDTIAKFIASEKPLVLVSPSAGVGLDLHDDLARFQILVKLPYPDLGDPMVEARFKLSPKWYNAVTARALIQTASRATRHYSDASTSFLLDANFSRFRKMAKAFLPQYFKEAIHEIGDLSEAHIGHSSSYTPSADEHVLIKP